MRTLKSDSKCLRFSSYDPNSVSTPSSGTVMRFINSLPGTYTIIHTIRYRCSRKCSSRNCFASTGDGAPAIRSTAVGGLRERDHFPNRRLAGQEGHDTIEPQSDAAVRRRPVLERLEEEAESRLRFLVG